MLLKESAINEDFIKYGTIERNKKTNGIYTYIGDIVDSTNSREGNILSLYCKDGLLFIRDREEFREKFVTVGAFEKINTISDCTSFTKEELLELSENSIRQIYEKIIKCIKVDEMIKDKATKSKFYSLEMLFYNSVCEVFGKDVFNDEINCYYNPRLLNHAINLVCGYFNWTFYEREGK